LSYSYFIAKEETEMKKEARKMNKEHRCRRLLDPEFFFPSCPSLLFLLRHFLFG
jgi:hypothetical protein